WRTSGIKAKMGMIGAKVGLRVAPVRLAPEAYPAALAECPSDVFRLDEQVIDPGSFLTCLARQHADRLALFDPKRLDAVLRAPGQVERFTATYAGHHESCCIAAKAIVLTAGEGNPSLQERLGLDAPAMQRRPLHMVLARGPLPELNGHCTEGGTPRVTI